MAQRRGPHIEVKATLASAAAILALIGTTFGGVQVLDLRYVSSQQFQDYQWSAMKDQLRRLRRELSEADGADRDWLAQDLQELLDRFCKLYPDDRECA